MPFSDYYRLAIMSILISGLSACSPRIPGDSEAALALEDIAAGVGSSRLKARTKTPSRQTIDFTVHGRGYTGDVYQPREGAQAGIVLIPGIASRGKDDPRLVAVANTLARLGFSALVPDLAGPRTFRFRASDVREVADVFSYLVSRSDMAPEGRAGIAGFSYGAGPVLLAALQTDIREQVRFVLAVGGYYDLRSVLTFFTTGYYGKDIKNEPGQVKHMVPNPYPKWVFMVSNADLLDDPDDQNTLHSLADDILSEVEPDMETVFADLGRDGRALYLLLTNDDPEHVPALIEKLSPRIRNELDGLDVARHDLSQLKARVILLHGREDDMIPYTESIALAHALAPGQAQLFLIDGLVHMDIKPYKHDIPHLIQAFDALLSERTGK